MEHQAQVKMNILSVKIVKENVDENVLFGHILRESHPVIARFGNHRVGTIFPEWGFGSPGSILSFYGEISILERIREQYYFREMSAQGVLELDFDDTQYDQTSCCKKVRFIRNQKITSNTPKGIQRKIRRIIKRQIARGEIENEWQYRPRTGQQRGAFPDTFFHLFFVDSSSTQKNMPLCIQLVQIKDNDLQVSRLETFDNYGFSSLSQHSAGVPMYLPSFQQRYD